MDSSLFVEQAEIGDAWVDCQDRLDVDDPATGEVMGSVPNLGGNGTEDAIDAANAAFASWTHTTAQERSAILRNIVRGAPPPVGVALCSSPVVRKLSFTGSTAVGKLPSAPALLSELPDAPAWVVADKGYSSDAFRAHICNMGAKPAVPNKNNEAAVRCPDFICRHRNQIERMWARLKEWRAVATHYEKTATSFMGVLCLAATIDGIKC